MPVEIEAIGNVEAYASVAVKSRVAGQLLKVHVGEGADVKRGELLFQIDPAPFEEQVRSAEAALLRDRAAERQASAAIAKVKAEAANARAQAQRYAELYKQGIGAREQADQYATAADAQDAQLRVQQAVRESASAAIAVDEAKLEEAERELSYTKITAPMSGRAGFVAIKAGNLVRENDTSPLVTILQVTPVFLTFSVPEKYLNDIRRAGAGLVATTTEGESGRLEVIDNTVDSTTGTIKLKAVFANTARRLWPGQFANVRLRLKVEAGAVVFPDAAVQTGPQGDYVWVAAGGVAQMRKVEVSRTQGGYCVVAQGVSVGEQVVTFGQLRLIPGAKLQLIGEQDASKPAGQR
jgi:multidrug efflux system membrane fusion protein